MKAFPATQARLILVCANTKETTDPQYCGNCGGKELHAALKQYILEKGLAKKVRAVKSGCLDYCGNGPIVCVEPEHVFYEKATLHDLDEIKKKFVDPLLEKK